MRVLLATHRFLPAHQAGTEVYTARLARALVDAGEAVEVLCAEKDVARPDLSLRERTYQGLPVHEVVNNLFHRSLRETWDHPRIDRVLGELLDRVQPDLLHIQHLLHLSSGLVGEARRRGVPVVMTLHDFWLQCPRFGQRVHVDGSVCETVELHRCAGCVARTPFALGSLERRLSSGLARLHATLGLDLGGPARAARRALAGRRRPPAAHESAPAKAQAAAQALEERARGLRERLAQVARFLSPSEFLRRELVAWGLPPERTLHLPTGLERRPAPRAPRETGAPLRVLFLGSRIRVKGAHILLEAWGRLSPELRARGELRVVGPDRHEPQYQAELRALAARAGARLEGAVPPARVPAELASADLLVVPSVWFENAPLVILEALSAGTALLVSDLGGMAELVEEGVGGWRFPPGDAQALAARLAWLLADPTRLDGLHPERTRLPTFAEHVAAVERIYRQVRREESSP